MYVCNWIYMYIGGIFMSPPDSPHCAEVTPREVPSLLGLSPLAGATTAGSGGKAGPKPVVSWLFHRLIVVNDL